MTRSIRAATALGFVVIILAGLLAGPTHAQEGPGTGPYHEQQTLGRGMLRSVAWSPAGDLIAAGGALGIWLYTPALEDVGRLQGHTKAVYDLAFSPDGARLASVSHDMTVRVWDLAAQAELLTMEGHTNLVVAAAWSPNGSTIASGSYDGTIRLWDAASGAPLGVIEAGHGWVNDLAYSPDGAWLASASQDGTAIVWDAAAREPALTLAEHDGAVTAVGFSPHGASILTASEDGLLRVWDTATGDLLRTSAAHDGPIEDAGWSPLGGVVAATWPFNTGMGALDVLDASLEPGDPLGHMVGNLGDRLSWSPDGGSLAAIAWTSMLSVWDALVCAPKLYRFEHTDWITAVGWDDAGTQVLAASNDGLVRVWDVASGDLLRTSLAEPVAPVTDAFSPDGTRRAVASTTGTTLTDAASGEVIATLPGAANALAWSPDGARLAVAVRNGTVKVWEDE